MDSIYSNKPHIPRVVFFMILGSILSAGDGFSQDSGDWGLKIDGSEISMNTGDLERVLDAPLNGHLRTVSLSNRKSGEERVAGKSDDFRIVCGKNNLTAGDFSIKSVDLDRAEHSWVEIWMIGLEMEVLLTYRIIKGDEFLTKQLRITNISKVPIRIDEVWVDSLAISTEDAQVKNNGLSDTVAFVRFGTNGFFLCLDFPYQNLIAKTGILEAGFPPHETLDPGQSFETHRAVLGAYQLSGIKEGSSLQLAGLIGEISGGQLVSRPSSKSTTGPDLGESSAWRNCIHQLYPPNPVMPQLWSGREWEGLLEELREQWGGKDPIYRNGYLPYVHEEASFYARLGFNNGWIGPEPAAWDSDDPDRDKLRKVLKEAKDAGLRLGLYSNSNRGQSLGSYWNAWDMNPPFPWDVPGAEILDASGNTIDAPLMCFGSKEFQKAWLDMYVPAVKLGMGNILWDFLILKPCYAPNHGHVPGDLYQQVKGLMHCMEVLHQIDPGFADYGCLGWGTMTPHAARFMDMFYLADPWMELPLPGLNQDVLLADSRRKQMRGFLIEGLPPRLLANCDFFAWPDSPVPNYITYRYQYMQALAISPNWTFEPQMLRDVPYKEYQNALDFIRYWNRWRKDRWQILNQIEFLSPGPGIGVLEAYMHTDGERGFLFLVNPNPFGLSKSLTVGEPIGLLGHNGYHLHQWFPEDLWLLPNSGPIVESGQNVEFTVPAFSVQLVEFIPEDLEEAPGIWGVPDYEIPQMGSLRFVRRTSVTRWVGIKLPPGETTARVMVDSQPVPCEAREGVVIFKDDPPSNISGERANPELRDWVVRVAELEEGLQQGLEKGFGGESSHFPLPSVLTCSDPAKLLENPKELRFEGMNIGKFLGAYIYNTAVRALRGPKRIARVELIPGETSASGLEMTQEKNSIPGLNEFSQSDKYWASTEITLPIVANTLYEAPLNYAEHYYILLSFIDYPSIEDLKVWINGEPAYVDSMGYVRSTPSQPPVLHPKKYKYSYYVDGSKWGLAEGKINRIVVFVKWKAS